MFCSIFCIDNVFVGRTLFEVAGASVRSLMVMLMLVADRWRRLRSSEPTPGPALCGWHGIWER